MFMCMYGVVGVEWSEVESSRVESSVTMPPGTVGERQTVKYTKTGERDKQAGIRGCVGWGRTGRDGTGWDGMGAL